MATKSNQPNPEYSPYENVLPEEVENMMPKSLTPVDIPECSPFDFDCMEDFIRHELRRQFC
ncbi:hypothetical protein [Paraburkholderia caribensis]|uniref:hypothetical protein n=1 Tax=Paraburkholderia caribensis TaxID=75105 RepID=UPI0015901D45|nr:hypothetical protein [Paraburkholderia caribensis]